MKKCIMCACYWCINEECNISKICNDKETEACDKLKIGCSNFKEESKYNGTKEKDKSEESNSDTNRYNGPTEFGRRRYIVI